MAEKIKKNEGKPSYEELEKIVSEAQAYISNLHTQEAIARLNYLFKVLEFAKHFDKKYVENAVADIQRILVMEAPETTEEVNTTEEA